MENYPVDIDLYSNVPGSPLFDDDPDFICDDDEFDEDLERYLAEQDAEL